MQRSFTCTMCNGLENRMPIFDSFHGTLELVCWKSTRWVEANWRKLLFKWWPVICPLFVWLNRRTRLGWRWRQAAAQRSLVCRRQAMNNREYSIWYVYIVPQLASCWTSVTARCVCVNVSKRQEPANNVQWLRNTRIGTLLPKSCSSIYYSSVFVFKYSFKLNGRHEFVCHLQTVVKPTNCVSRGTAMRYTYFACMCKDLLERWMCVWSGSSSVSAAAPGGPLLAQYSMDTEAVEFVNKTSQYRWIDIRFQLHCYTVTFV